MEFVPAQNQYQQLVFFVSQQFPECAGDKQVAQAVTNGLLRLRANGVLSIDHLKTIPPQEWGCPTGMTIRLCTALNTRGAFGDMWNKMQAVDASADGAIGAVMGCVSEALAGTVGKAGADVKKSFNQFLSDTRIAEIPIISTLQGNKDGLSTFIKENFQLERDEFGQKMSTNRIYHEGWLEIMHSRRYGVLYKNIRSPKYQKQTDEIVGLYWFTEKPTAKNGCLYFPKGSWEGTLPIGRDPSFQTVDKGERRFRLVTMFDLEGSLALRRLVCTVLDGSDSIKKWRSAVFKGRAPASEVLLEALDYNVLTTHPIQLQEQIRKDFQLVRESREFHAFVEKYEMPPFQAFFLNPDIRNKIFWFFVSAFINSLTFGVVGTIIDAVNAWRMSRDQHQKEEDLKTMRADNIEVDMLLKQFQPAIEEEAASKNITYGLKGFVMETLISICITAVISIALVLFTGGIGIIAVQPINMAVFAVVDLVMCQVVYAINKDERKNKEDALAIADAEEIEKFGGVTATVSVCAKCSRESPGWYCCWCGKRKEDVRPPSSSIKPKPCKPLHMEVGDIRKALAFIAAPVEVPKPSQSVVCETKKLENAVRWARIRLKKLLGGAPEDDILSTLSLPWEQEPADIPFKSPLRNLCKMFEVRSFFDYEDKKDGDADKSGLMSFETELGEDELQGMQKNVAPLTSKIFPNEPDKRKEVKENLKQLGLYQKGKGKLAVSIRVEQEVRITDQDLLGKSWEAGPSF
eukprot:CAMPEP_0177640816 /NCGR_PEP_ID=MMETSP0447-20121125/6741_1 /TAXON_ID=0 /ORGANISM="Stygamoeba regulata, Strain BSH-02190019" /LENGTH=743 /DNA_ID=CAMNT_0019142905 /DNA_START=133 /DNA_END=2364 /DNA_ORIENTATION=+